MCQLKKSGANDITKPLAFTVCKLELCGKAIVLQSRPGAHDLNMVNYGQNETKATSFVRTKTNQGAIATVQVQGGTHFSQGQRRTKQKEKKTYFHKTKTNRGESAAVYCTCSFKNARRHLFRTIKNPTTKNNPDSYFLESLSRNIAFFCFPLSFSY